MRLYEAENNAENRQKITRESWETLPKREKITQNIKRNGREIPKSASEFPAFFRILQVFYQNKTKKPLHYIDKIQLKV